MLKRPFASSLVLLLVLVSVAGFGSQALADEPPPTPQIGSLPLNTGNWEVAGSASYSRNVRTNSRNFSLIPHAEYFFANRFSAGGTIAYSDYAVNGLSSSSFILGPSITYYFAHTARTAWSLDQSVLFSTETASNTIQGTTGLAFDYFFSSSIAFGPELQALYYFSGGVDKPDDSVRVLFHFSMFL